MTDFLPDDDDLEPLLRDYLSAQLDGQVGKAPAGFAEASAQATAPRRSAPRRGRLIAAALATAASLAAAVWCLVHVSGGLARRHQTPDAGAVASPSEGATSKPGRGAAKDAAPADAVAEDHGPPVTPVAHQPTNPPGEPLLVGQQLQWRTIDEGIVYLDPHTPVRKLRRQRLERIQWYDAARGAHVQMIVPREEIQFVAITSS